MGLLVLSLLCLLVVVDAKSMVSKKKKHVVKPLYKRHQHHMKLHPQRWIKRSDERRAKLGLPKWTPKKRQSSPSVPTWGDYWPVAIYWSFLTIGSNKAQFPVAIDSGSYTLDIPLIGCNGCTTASPNNFYNPANSTTSHVFTCGFAKPCTPQGSSCHLSKKTCGFSNTYEGVCVKTCVPTDPTAPCTITGTWYQDNVSWGGTASVPVQFGAIEYQTSNFEQFQNIDGVVGMAGPAVPESVISQLANNNAIPEWLWSICLQPGSVSNGTITIGGIDSRLYTGQVVYTPDVGQGQFYEMNLNGISVGNTSVYIDEQQVIIDSGTNILLLPDESFSNMKSVFLGLCNQGYNLHGICDVSSSQTLFDGNCYVFTQNQINQFPNITIAVPNINLVINPINYILLNYGTNFQPGQSCLGISNTGPQGLQIVGDTLLANYYTVFDQTNQQIGWAPVSSRCGNIH